MLLHFATGLFLPALLVHSNDYMGNVQKMNKEEMYEYVRKIQQMYEYIQTVIDVPSSLRVG